MLGALHEAAAGDLAGALVQAPVGAGKTLPFLLAPAVLEADKYLQVVPAHLREKTRADHAYFCALGFALPPLRLVSYHDISSKNWREYLVDDMDLVVCDEVQALRNLSAGRTKRVREYFYSNPQTRFVAFSATLTTGRLSDINHLADWALRDRSPLPRQYRTAENWSNALDPDVPENVRPDPGVFLAWPGANGATPLEAARRAFALRFRETPGIFIGTVSSTDVPLALGAWDPGVGKASLKALAELEATWQRPDGHQLLLATEHALAAKTLSLGFYHRWVEYPQQSWYDARTQFSRFVNNRLRIPLYTEGDVVRAHPNAPEVLEWKKAEQEFKPQSVAVWVDDFVLRKAAEWLLEAHGRIVWVKHPAVGFKLAELSGVEFYGRGPGRGEALAKGSGNAIASWPSHGTGTNLQRFWEALVLEPPTKAWRWEQLIGRHHRQGQTESVRVWTNLNHNTLLGVWKDVLEEAVVLETRDSQPMKLLHAEVLA